MEKAFLVTARPPASSDWIIDDLQDELRELAIASGLDVIEKTTLSLKEINPRYFIGSGHLQNIARKISRLKIDIVVFSHNLTGSQQRNIEEELRVKTIDRTQLILHIFARRARSNEGKLQVELAQLEYLLPRLTGKGIMLSRLGGGVGTLGPGEQKLEIDRRRIRHRVDMLRKRLVEITDKRRLQRLKRHKHSVLTAALVGYTNAGKSTLFNAITQANAVVRDRLFSTLDPLVRRLELSNHQKILISDTVGFLNELPHNLIESFKATLEEVRNADFLIHVIDVSSPLLKEKEASVERVQIGRAHV